MIFLAALLKIDVENGGVGHYGSIPGKRYGPELNIDFFKKLWLAHSGFTGKF